MRNRPTLPLAAMKGDGSPTVASARRTPGKRPDDAVGGEVVHALEPAGHVLSDAPELAVDDDL